MWRLNEGGDRSLGLCCSEDGLFLARTPLVVRRDGGYAVRPRADLERLFGRAYRAAVDLDRLMLGLAVVKAALDARNLCLAQIAAVQLRVPELPDLVARSRMKAEDQLIKTERGVEILMRGDWDPAPPRYDAIVNALGPAPSPKRYCREQRIAPAGLVRGSRGVTPSVRV
jgi:hypothetical protein